MQLGKDFYKIVNLVSWIGQLLTWIGQFVNTDTPQGELKDPEPPK